MSGLFTDVWKIVKPTSPKQGYVNASPDDFRLYSNFSWYTKIMKGAGSRFAKYNQYNNMDNDVFVARALDTIAEEIATTDDHTDLPFDIQYQNEVNREVPESIVTTVRAALRHWCTIHKLGKKTFDIARLTIKYGDCFFRKTSDFKQWEYVEPNNVIGVSINGLNEIEFYQLRKGSDSANDRGSPGDVEIVPAAGMVHFSLSSGIGNSGPFGNSVLEPCIKAFRHLSLLEDSVIIYRIVRAPERRVFNIDVGNMPPQRAKAYLEAIKNDLRQKKIPNDAGGQEKIDSVYNPLSMSEDFFFAQTADGRGNKIDTLPGGENLGEIGDLNYFQNKFLQGLRIPSSYMRGSNDTGSQVSDGKVGVAYIEELRFASYVKRLQQNISPVFDQHFKAYLKSAGLVVDPDVFRLALVDPQNFDIYRRAEVDEKLIGNYNTIKDDETISTRTKQRLFLGWSEDDIQANEIQLKQERGIPEGGLGLRMDETRMMYDPKWIADRPSPKVAEHYDNFETESEEFVTKKPKEKKEADLLEPDEGGDEAPKDEDAGDEAPKDEGKDKDEGSGDDAPKDEGGGEDEKEDAPSDKPEDLAKALKL